MDGHGHTKTTAESFSSSDDDVMRPGSPDNKPIVSRGAVFARVNLELARQS